MYLYNVSAVQSQNVSVVVNSAISISLKHIIMLWIFSVSATDCKFIRNYRIITYHMLHKTIGILTVEFHGVPRWHLNKFVHYLINIPLNLGSVWIIQKCALNIFKFNIQTSRNILCIQLESFRLLSQQICKCRNV